MKNLSLALCGLENLPIISKDQQHIIFGEWMSELPEESNTDTLMFFPFDFKLKSDLQTENDIINQDKKVRHLYKDLLSKLKTILNAHHEENFSNRQWELIIGPWLRYFLDFLMVRWVLVSAALSLEVNRIYILDTNQSKVYPQPKTRDDFSVLVNSSKIMNQFFISTIVSIQIENHNIRSSVETITMDEINNSLKTEEVKKQPFNLKQRKRIKNLSKKIIEFISSKFNSNLLLYSPNLGLINMLKLGVKLKKIPYIYFLKDSSSISNDSLLHFTEQSNIISSEGSKITNISARNIMQDLGG